MTLQRHESSDQIPPEYRRLGVAIAVTLLALTLGCAAQPEIDGPRDVWAENVGQCDRGMTMVCEAVSLSMLASPPSGACQCQRLAKYIKPVNHRQINRRRPRR
ncbi:MAG: hypothetical protein KJO82_15060 [Gammaproteobacteria bacterium]|nr:hypothetical protein [Gammaproteobacteria bacterium]